MGIYSNGKIYGVAWSIDDDNNDSYIPKIKFEKIFPDVMNNLNIQEIAQEYEKFSETDRNKARYRIHTLCSSTYRQDSANFFSWMPVSKEIIDKFLLGFSCRI
jgi:hypothetical protein